VPELDVVQETVKGEGVRLHPSLPRTPSGPSGRSPTWSGPSCISFGWAPVLPARPAEPLMLLPSCEVSKLLVRRVTGS